MGFRRRVGALAAGVVAAGLVAMGGSPAPAANCAYPSAYPGDNASKEMVAAWMAGGAIDAGLPGELPVMAALVESGMKNLNVSDSDSVGYFQIPQRIWNSGDYMGYPDHPTLQLQWFIDQAQAVRQQRIAGGDANFGKDPSKWGEWVADVERPAQQYRYRYQLRLDEARQLIATGCAAPDSTPAPGRTTTTPSDPGTTPTTTQPVDAQMVAESVLPSLKVVIRRYQDAARRKQLVVEAVCANERCLLRAAAAFAVPNRKVFRLTATPQQARRGQKRSFRLALSRRAQGIVARADCPLAVVRVVAANAGGYRLSASRTVVMGTRRDCS